MKELSIEEKAKRYDDLLVKLQKAKVDNNVCDERYCCVIDNIVPELKESEGEKVCKEIKQFIRSRGMQLAQSKVESWLAWLEEQGDANKEYWRGYREGKKEILDKCSELEKQGEQKSVDKVEPKFKVGDYITDVQGIETNKIVGYEDDSYLIRTSCSQFYLPMKLTEKNYRLWSIADAKDGDVLVNDFHLIFILKEIKNNTFVSHCSVIEMGNDVITNSIAEREVGDSELVKVYPATQEQRSKLFSKMAEEGYEWDAKKKELKKVEQESWSKADETALYDALWCCEQAASIAKDENDMGSIWSAETWLKSLRPKNTWKPSEAQMKWLHDAIESTQYEPRKQALVSLYSDLMELKDEK